MYMISVFLCISLHGFLHLCNLPCAGLHYSGSYLLQYMFLTLKVFAFGGQNTKFTVNVLHFIF